MYLIEDHFAGYFMISQDNKDNIFSPSPKLSVLFSTISSARNVKYLQIVKYRTKMHFQKMFFFLLAILQINFWYMKKTFKPCSCILNQYPVCKC